MRWAKRMLGHRGKKSVRRNKTEVGACQIVEGGSRQWHGIWEPGVGKVRRVSEDRDGNDR